MNNDCPTGIRNAKEIEKLDQRSEMMFRHMTEGMLRMEKKLDDIKKDVEELKKNIPEIVNEAVDKKWKAGVYSTIKWLVITVCVAVIGAVVRILI